ncbi:DUF1697 domain-containing protein [Microbacterium sp. NPDC078428]|uniref:DUF1697 domain-containing protein n=1 Tax=Microbacterium sp. NPDC078428 TaxID=3364190 RepID=UPI0037C7A048
MTEWVVLLRGVNVGGVTVRSAELRDLLAGLGFAAARTYLASGNARVASDLDAAALRGLLEPALSERFGYDATVLVAPLAHVDRVVREFPFDETDGTRQPWVLFCADEGTRDELTGAAASLDPDVDPVRAGQGVVYWHPEKGRSTDTPFAKVVARATYRARTTNRNLRTLRRILD